MSDASPPVGRHVGAGSQSGRNTSSDCLRILCQPIPTTTDSRTGQRRARGRGARCAGANDASTRRRSSSMASETREGVERGVRARMRGDFEDAWSSGVRLENARACAYLGSIARASEEVRRDARALDLDGAEVSGGTLSGWVASMGLDASAARALESAVFGTPSGGARGAASLLPEVSIQDFEAYLRKTREWYAEFVEQRAYAASARAGRAPSTRGGGDVADGGASDLGTVPALFFDDDFDLSRPETFSRACGRVEARSVRDLARAATETQEDLSAHLDVVEQHLVREIDAKSAEFFEALKELHGLHESMSETQRQVGKMRQNVREIGELLVKPGRVMKSLYEKRDNLRGLTDLFAQIASVQQMRLDMDVFVESTDYPGALQIAEDVRQTLRDNPMLADLACFQKLPEYVTETVTKVREVMISDFIAGVKLPGDAKAAISKPTLERLAAVAESSGLETSSSSKDLNQVRDTATTLLDSAIPPLISVLYSGNAFLCDALEAWSSSISEDVRQVERVAMGVMLSRFAGERRITAPLTVEESAFDSAYATAIRKLPAELFAEMLSALTEVFNAYFERAAQIKLIIRGIVGGDEDSLKKLRDVDETLVSAAMEAASRFDYSSSHAALNVTNEALSKIIDIAQGRFAKLLGIRAPMNVSLSSREFVRIIDSTDKFLQSAETLGKHRCLSLRSTLANQSKVFIREQHATSTTKLGSLLECETWTVAKLPKQFQGLVDALLDDTALKIPDVENEDIGDESIVNVFDERFHLVNSANLSLQMVTEYIRLARQIPSFATDATRRMIDLIKQYNAGVCQLILGAGAMQVSKLKSITAKHLCLAEQSVSFFVTLLPRVQEIMCALIDGPKNTLLRQEFERMLRDLKLHKSEIHDKLVSIMSDRVDFHLERLSVIIKSLRDEEGEPRPESKSVEFATPLTKELGTLRRVISELLCETDKRRVLGRVRSQASEMIASRIKAFDACAESNERVAERLSVDVDAVMSSLRELPTLEEDEDDADALETLAEKLRARRPPPTLEPDVPPEDTATNTREEPQEEHEHTEPRSST